MKLGLPNPTAGIVPKLDAPMTTHMQTPAETIRKPLSPKQYGAIRAKRKPGMPATDLKSALLRALGGQS